MRKLLPLVGVLLLMGLLAPIPARASTTLAATARGTMTFWDNECVPGTTLPHCEQNGGTKRAAQPTGVYAPWSPTCTKSSLGLCRANVHWVFASPESPTQPVPCTSVQSGAGSGSCEVRAYGDFFNSSGLGPWCGFTQGPVNIGATIGTFSDELSGSGNLHGGPLAGAWRITRAVAPFDGKGVATMEAASVPACGLNPLDGFQGTHSLDVTLTFTWTDRV